MTRQAIIKRTIDAINKLPEEKAVEISDFADFISKRYEEQSLSEGIREITSSSDAFKFLSDEEDLYELSDLKKIYG